jgi:hypothetical protein
VEWGYKQNSIFFNFLKEKLIFFFLYLNSIWKMCSFEVHNVDVAQKLKDWEGPSISYNRYYSPPPTFLVFELPQHHAPQKNTFFI